ncbi:MAG: DUF3857 domain-containing protein [Lentisphaeria bacterium]|nr:DUF3857 domain-containing protein [Lentisphaeria bacterium]
MKNMLKKTISLLVLVLVAVQTVPAGDLAPEELRKLESGATKQKYPDSDTVLLYDLENIRYEENGLSESTDEYYQKALTESGRRQLRSFTFYFNSTYETVTVEKVLVLRGGKVKMLDPAKNTKVSIDPGQMGSNIYDPASKVLTLTIPEVRIGDVVGIRTRRIVKKARIPGFWGDYIALQGNMPIKKYVVMIDAPRSKPLRSKVIKDSAGTGVKFGETIAGDRIRYRWEAADVPQAIPEPDMPPLYTAVQRLLVGTAGSWEEISKWYSALCRPRLDAADDAIRAEVKKLTAGRKTDDEKIRALFKFVSQKIRYMGITPESEAPGYEPHDVTMTFHRRYGVCRDKAALLTAMLEIAGFKAYPVLIMAGVPKDDDVPNGYFNHAVTAVEGKDGKYILMDPTDENAGELLPATLANCSYLAARPQGDKLRRTPSPAAERNQLRIRSDSVLEADGRLTGPVELDLTGVNDQIYRNALSRWTREETDQYFARQMTRAIPGAEIRKLEIFPKPVRDTSKPLRIVLNYTADGVPVNAHSPVVLQLPELGDVLGASGLLMGSFALDRRKFKLRIHSTFSVREDLTLKLPRHLRLQGIPKPESENGRGLLRWSRRIEEKDGVIRGSRFFAVDSLEFTPKEYAAARELLQRVDTKKRADPVVIADYARVRENEMSTVFPGADTAVLNDDVKYTLKNSGTWTEERNLTVKVLTYSGLKKSGDLRVEFNPAFEQVEISGQVVSPSGQVRKLGREELNLMDSGWNSRAPRYPGAKVLAANFPGVEVGSKLQFSIRKTVTRPFFGKILTFAGPAPGVRRSRTIDLPAQLILHRSQLPGGIAFTERLEGNRRILSWTATSTPKVPAELGQPPLWYFAPTVMVSTGRLSDYAKLLNDTFTRLSAPERNPEAAALARKLTGNVPKDATTAENLRRKVKIIRNYAAKHIRAAGPGLKDLPLSALSNADVTLRSGYGNSADRAILLAAMLRALKIDVEFYPVSGLLYTMYAARFFERYPQQIFSGVLVAVPKLDILLNDTSQYADLGAINTADRLALSLRSRRLEALRETGKHESRTQRRIHVQIAPDGSADITITDHCYGAYFEAGNRLYSELTPELRKRHFAELAAELSRAARITGEPETDFSSVPGVVKYSLHCPGFASKTGNFLEFDLPYFLSFSEAAGLVKKVRGTPYLRDTSLNTSIRYEITFPKNFSVSGTRTAQLALGDYGIGTFSRSYAVSKGRLEIECRLKLPSGIVPADDCDKLFRLRRRLARPESRKIILIPNG